MIVFLVTKKLLRVAFSKSVRPINELLGTAILERDLKVTRLLLASYHCVLQLHVPVDVVLAVVLFVEILHVVVKFICV